MKLIQTKDYLLLIEKVYGFKVGDWNYEEDNTIPVYQFSYDIDKYPGNKIIAYHPLTKEAKDLDLPLLPPFKVDIEKLAEDRYGKYETSIDIPNKYLREGFIEGYKAAQSKQFTLEDVRKAHRSGFNRGSSSFPEDFLTEDEYIQSLSTQQLPKEFIPELVIISNDEVYFDKQLKTITNSENKEVLVGTYKY